MQITKKKVVKTMLFIMLWIMSFFSGIYLWGALFSGTTLSIGDWLLYVCTFGFSFGLLWFNIAIMD